MIYIVCPSKYATGGTELLHQLCVEICSHNIDVAIVYDGDMTDSPIINKFSCYKVRVEKTIVDDKNNILIIPETAMRFLLKYRKIQKVIWWLSVDNYAPNKKEKTYAEICIYKIIDCIVRLYDRKCIHLVQSEYAKKYVEFVHGIDNSSILYLSDYISKEYFRDMDRDSIRENIVLYNPKKGLDFTNKLISKGAKWKWIPLINLSKEEMKLLMNKAKVYVDFGNHPGKDRIPREAAISGCCVITGIKGSAKYYEDVPIPSCAKFDQDKENIDVIINYILRCMDNYDNEIEKYDEYRTIIKSEQLKFKKDVITFLNRVGKL